MSEIEIIDVVNFNNNVTQNIIFEIYCVFVRTKTTWYKQIKNKVFSSWLECVNQLNTEIHKHLYNVLSCSTVFFR